MKRFLFAVFLLLLPKTIFADSISGIERQNIQTTLDILKEKFRESDDNYIVSGTSVSFAAAMIANGVSGKSLAELSKILGNYSIDNINESLYIDIKNSGFTLELSNSIWGNKFTEEYKQELSRCLNAEAQPLPKNTSFIDDWIKEKTNGKIEKLYGNNPTNLLDLYLVNTVYFKDEWQNKFKKERTQEKPFHNLNSGDSIVPMLHNTDKYAYMENENFYSIKLPYQNSGTMYIFLPKEAIDFKNFINNFDLSQFFNQQYSMKKVYIQLPKFRLEAKTDLKSIFIKLGIKEIFNEKNNDFNKMTSLGGYVKRILQNTVIEMDEEGTTAAAATAIHMRKRRRQKKEEITYFIADRPFLFYIDKGNFMGIVTNFKN